MDKTKRLVKLKNGSEEFEPLVKTTMLVLEKMFEFREDKPLGSLLFYELVEFCKDSNHKFFGNMGKDLEELTLLTVVSEGKYQVHGSIKNVVLSAAEGEGLDLCLVNPMRVM